MLTRRITASACALALVVPAAAMARPGADLPVAYGGTSAAKTGAVAYGDTKYDLQSQQDQNASKPSYADRVGSLSAEQLAAAYGTAKPATRATAPVVSDGDGANGWQIAALAEAGLLAALALGSVGVVRARRRVVA